MLKNNIVTFLPKYDKHFDFIRKVIQFLSTLLQTLRRCSRNVKNRCEMESSPTE